MSWYSDKSLIDVLGYVLTENERSKIVSMKVNSYNALLDIIESKMLLEMSKIISGKYASQTNYEESIKIRHLFEEFERQKYRDH